MSQVILVSAYCLSILQLNTERYKPIQLYYFTRDPLSPLGNLRHRPDHQVQTCGDQQKHHVHLSDTTAYPQHAVLCWVLRDQVLTEAYVPEGALMKRFQ